MAPLEPHGDAFGRWLGVAIVVTTLAGAVMAYAQARSVQRHDEAASRSEQWATLGAGVRSRSEAAAQLQIARARLAHNERVSAEQAEGKRLFAPDGDARWLAIQARVRGRVADTMSRRSATLAAGVDAEFDEMDSRAAAALPNVDPRADRVAECETRSSGTPRSPPPLPAAADPNSDPLLIVRYLADSRRESYRFDALRQGATHEAEAAEKQFTRYAVSLAMFAAAVFLFGYALTPYGHRYRRLYTVAGAGFAILSTAWGLWAFARSPHEPARQAAAAYADGRAAFEGGDYSAAVHAFDCAIELNEEFPAAYLARGDAYSLLGSPQQDEPIFNEGLVDPRFMRHATEDGEHAEELTGENPSLLISRGTQHFVNGLIAHDSRELERALELHEESREMLPNHPVPRFNIGTTELALRRPWRRSYDEAERLMGDLSPAFVAAALTDLAGVDARLPAAHEDVIAAKDDVVAAASGAASDTPAPVRLRDVKLVVTPGAFAVDFAGPRGFRADKEAIFAAVYQQTARGWGALSSFTGLLPVVRSVGANRWSAGIMPFSPPTACRSSGRYRVELYVNGRSATGGSQDTTVALPPLKHETLPDIGVDLCRPPGWHRVSDAIPGVVDGFTSPDRDIGVIVFDVTAAADANIGVEQQTKRIRNRFRRLLPGPTTTSGKPQPGYFMGVADGAWRFYRYRDGGMLMATGTTPAGRALVAAVFGPPSAFEHAGDPTRFSVATLLASLTSRDLVF